MRVDKRKELTRIWRDKTALWLDEGSIRQKNESPVQLSVFSFDILHTVLPAQLTHTPADLLSPTHVTSNWQKRHL